MNRRQSTTLVTVLTLAFSACTVPGEFDGAWRTNVHDEEFEAPETCGDGNLDEGEGETCDDGNLEPDDGCDAACQAEGPGGEDFCGDGELDDGEACDDGNLEPDDGCDEECDLEARCGDEEVSLGEECDDGNDTSLCDSECQWIDCGGGPPRGPEEHRGDKLCESLHPHAVCVVGDDHPVCLRREMGFDSTPEFLKTGLFMYCADSDSGPIPDGAESCRESEDCHHGQQCYLFDIPEAYQGLCWISDAPADSQAEPPPSPHVPGWQVFINGDTTDCLPMACDSAHHNNYCRVRDAFGQNALSAYCSNIVSDKVRNEAGAGVCVLAECTENNAAASPSCTESFSLSSAVCNDDGHCVGVGNDDNRMCSDEDLPFACEDACMDPRCDNCEGEACAGCGGAAFDLCDWDQQRDAPVCRRCFNDLQCDDANYQCYRPPGTPENQEGVCRRGCANDVDCAFRAGGRCTGPPTGPTFCEKQGGDGPHEGCERDQDCADHETCDNQEQRCVPRPCNQGCPEGTQCNQGRQICEPMGGGGPPMLQTCQHEGQCPNQHHCEKYNQEHLGVCIPLNCWRQPCPGGYACQSAGDHGFCRLVDGCTFPEDEHGRTCGHSIGLRQCAPLPDEAGAPVCYGEVRDHVQNHHCQSDDDCSWGFCRPTSGDCINLGPACDGREAFDGYCQDRHQPPANNCDPTGGATCNDGYSCREAQEYVGEPDRSADRGVCQGNTCTRHDQCGFGQACYLDAERGEGRCKQRIFCRVDQENPAICPESQACIPLWGFGLDGGEFCVTGPCNANNDCQQNGFNCSNSRCVGRDDNCQGSVFDSMCADTVAGAQDNNDDPNDWDVDNPDNARTVQVDGPLTFNLGPADQDVFLYQVDNEAQRVRFSVTHNDHFPSVRCFLVQVIANGERSVVAVTDGWENGCSLEHGIVQSIEYRFVIHKVDLLDQSILHGIQLSAHVVP